MHDRRRRGGLLLCLLLIGGSGSAQEPRLAEPPPVLPFEKLDEAALNAGRDIKPIRSLGVEIRPPAGELPEHVDPPVPFVGQTLDYRGRGFALRSPWHGSATAYCHQPLYFEEPNLERYGYSFGVWQPLVSAAHFYGTVPLLPYRIYSQPPRSLVSTVRYPAAGMPAPPAPVLEPVRLDAAFFEGAIAAYLVFLIP